MSKIRFPSIANVAQALREINAGVDVENERHCDVRLQVYPDGHWAMHVGPSDYDQDHRGFWGCSSLDGRRFNSEREARDLLGQVKEHAAQARSDAE